MKSIQIARNELYEIIVFPDSDSIVILYNYENGISKDVVYDSVYIDFRKALQHLNKSDLVYIRFTLVPINIRQTGVISSKSVKECNFDMCYSYDNKVCDAFDLLLEQIITETIREANRQR